VRLTTPIRDADVRRLKVGDVVLLDGIVFTGRDAVHKYLHDGGDLDVIQKRRVNLSLRSGGY
jgi:tartrate dehydratase beta subunit/fumarate hydratase class I family protein